MFIQTNRKKEDISPLKVKEILTKMTEISKLRDFFFLSPEIETCVNAYLFHVSIKDALKTSFASLLILLSLEIEASINAYLFHVFIKDDLKTSEDTLYDV